MVSKVDNNGCSKEIFCVFFGCLYNSKPMFVNKHMSVLYKRVCYIIFLGEKKKKEEKKK
jgi:hypothetical protein